MVECKGLGHRVQGRGIPAFHHQGKLGDWHRWGRLLALVRMHSVWR